MSTHKFCRKGFVRASTSHEESFCFETIFLPGPSSSAKELSEPGSPKGRDITVVSALLSPSRLPRLLALVSSISVPPPAIGLPPLHAIKATPNKGLGMFARRDIQKGELIVWERPAVIVPGLERDDETAQEAYRLLAEGFLEAGRTEEIHLGSMEEIRAAAKERYEDVRGMAISSSFRGGHWLEGVVRTNALVLEFEEVRQKKKEDKRVIYGGVFPLINRCNHRFVTSRFVLGMVFEIYCSAVSLMLRCILYRPCSHHASMLCETSKSGRRSQSPTSTHCCPGRRD